MDTNGKTFTYTYSASQQEELKRIREIQEERRQIRYCICLRNGDSERDAALALEI